MAIEKPDTGTKKKRIKLPGGLGLLENVLNPIYEAGQNLREAESNPTMQMLMGFLGPPGRIPPVRMTTRTAKFPVAADRIEKFYRDILLKVAETDPLMARTIRNVIFTPYATQRIGALAYFRPAGDVVVGPQGTSVQTFLHEGIHGIDRVALEKLAPRSAKLPTGKSLQGPFNFTDLFNRYMAKPPRSSTVANQEFGRNLYDRLFREASVFPVGYAGQSLRHAPLFEQAAVIGSSAQKTPPNWENYLNMLRYIVEGK